MIEPRLLKRPLGGLAAWLEPYAPAGFTREMALELDVAHARMQRRLVRQLYPVGEPTDAMVRKRVAAICKGLGLKRVRRRGRIGRRADHRDAFGWPCACGARELHMEAQT